MSAYLCNLLMTGEAQLVAGKFCLTTELRATELMNHVAGHTVHPAISVPGLLPVDVLLVMPLGKAGFIKVLVTKFYRFIVAFERLTRLKTDGPSRSLYLRRFTAIVA